MERILDGIVSPSYRARQHLPEWPRYLQGGPAPCLGWRSPWGRLPFRSLACLAPTGDCHNRDKPVVNHLTLCQNSSCVSGTILDSWHPFNWFPKSVKKARIGVCGETMKTTDSEHTEKYRLLHGDHASYASSSIKYFPEISLLIDYLKPKSVLDYGCGKGALIKALALKYPEIAFHGYDPSISGLEKLPVDSADLVVNTDVLEHIPVDLIPNVLKEIVGISKNAVFGCHHALARATLADGTNAHCTVRPPIWYQNQIMNAFGDEITALEGRESYSSLVLTFPIHAHVFRKYQKMVRRNARISLKPESSMRRFLRHVRDRKF